VTMIGLDVTHKALFTKSHEDRLSGRVGDVVRGLMSFYGAFHRARYGWDGSPIHDAVAVAHVLDHGLVHTVERGVEVDTGGELSRGRTYVDLWRSTTWEPNAHVGVDIDAGRFLDLLVERLNTLG
jgi:pyrimidine-specific ribonucleoside hydrolase